ncbi:MAG: hypothetical protein GY862_07700 [Gammaproteobacteria bacterium]|nr:hypothetical protein [Gammaproteobacteria bacterium]
MRDVIPLYRTGNKFNGFCNTWRYCNSDDDFCKRDFHRRQGTKMTAPTHIAFGVLCAAVMSAGYGAGAAAAFGSLLPDIDHPQSTLGRAFYFISEPLNKKFGHRKLIHSVFLWGILVAVGVYTEQTIILYLGVGAWSHLFIDTFTVSGVQALEPFSNKRVVTFKRDWRVITGTGREILIFLALVAMVGVSGYAETLGGWRKLTNMLVRSHKIAAEEYARAGNRICRMEGEFRWADGKTESADWQVVGTSGRKIVYWNGDRVVRDPDHGKFIRARLVESEAEWKSVKVDGFCEVKSPSFFFDGKTWIFAQTGATAYGTVKAIDGGETMIKPVDLVSKIFAPANNAGRADEPTASMAAEPEKTPGVLIAHYVKNYDGDTITVNIPSMPALIGDEIAVRIANIDTPEIKGTRGKLHEKALEAKGMVEDLCKGYRMEIHNYKRGTFFRIVGDVYCDGKSVADILLSADLARPFEKGDKKPWK